ncbi:hypothetical protein, partial [Streptomyces laurentii]|uniref:hypothetical protein n=1 Tax=Streptomyces laurentii TaxID=39478 RepID=UPI0033E666E9
GCVVGREQPDDEDDGGADRGHVGPAGPIPAQSAGIRSILEFAERIPRAVSGMERSGIPEFGRRSNVRALAPDFFLGDR